MAGYCLNIETQEPEGLTTYSLSQKASIICFIAFLESCKYPLLKAGCPQQVCFFGKSTEQPSFSKSSIVSFPTFGLMTSHIQVINKETFIRITPFIVFSYLKDLSIYFMNW